MNFFRKADRPYQSLLFSFIILILLPGVAEGQFWTNRLFDIGFFSVLIFGALIGQAEKKVFHSLMGLAILAIISRASLWYFDEPFLLGVYLATAVLFMAIILVVLGRHVFFSRKIDANIIYGAVCIYFFFGLLFAIIYMGLESIAPGAFSFPQEILSSVSAKELSPELKALVYFSFVTQTTLGFGDITPVLPLARNLAILQSITGQMYIAILIARLIGVSMAQRK